MAAPRLNQRTDLDGIFAALIPTFEEEHRPGGMAAAAALRRARSQPYRGLQATADPKSLLETVCTQPGALAIAASILACRSLIAWSNWTGEGLADDLSSGLYTAELIGPDGHIVDDNVRIGLLISDAAIDYPMSRHSGEETYIVISGVAEWSVDNGPYSTKAPGSLIHHPAWVPHGRRTSKEPFLGAWRWSGDLDLSSFSVDRV